ncbi:MAG: hypothetical protein ACR2NS_04875 [Gemmatimonadaceae bacterium]
MENFADELDLGGEVPAAAALLEEMRRSSDQGFFSKSLLAVSHLHPTPQHFHTWLAAIATTNVGREYLAVGFAREGLLRAEPAVARLANLVTVLRSANPPERSLKRLSAAASMYLAGFDLGCIALCRAIVEVLVEEFAAPEDVEKLGAAIKRFRNHGTAGHRKLTTRQGDDMFFINDQAKEVLHDDPAPDPPDPLGCLERLARLLTELHPESIVP